MVWAGVLAASLHAVALIVACTGAKPSLAQEFTVGNFGADLAMCGVNAKTCQEYDACRTRTLATYAFDAGDSHAPCMAWTDGGQ